MQEVIYTVHIEPAEEGGYVAYFPSLAGCQTQGESLEEVIVMAKNALSGYLETLKKHGKILPRENSVSKLVGLDLPVSASLA